MFIRCTFRLSNRIIRDSQDLLLEKFACENGITSVSQKLSQYIKSKTEYDAFIDKYEVFGAREKSVEEAARMVGLKVPNNR